jgi:glycosyltransferase involved in cell wall biosynthesis
MELAGRAGFKKEKLQLLHNFVPSFCSDYNNSSEQKQDYFFFAGRLSSEKGSKNLIEAFELLPDIPLRIAGTGPDEIKLKLYCEQKKLKNIKFLGALAKEELEEEYKNCVALLLPSLWFETFGMTILEAFACGKPVIANNKGAISELIEDGKTGFLVETSDSQVWAKVIKKLWNNKKLAKTMGLHAQEKAMNYNSDDHIDELLKLYESVIKINKRITD